MANGREELPEELEARQDRWRRHEVLAITEPKQTFEDPAEVSVKQQRWRRSIETSFEAPETELLQQAETTMATTMSHANAMQQHRGGMDFFGLARGGERNYSTSFLINLDPDLLWLCSGDRSTFDMSLEALISHTKRIFQIIKSKSKRELNQFCFGSTHVQLNPNYRKFDRMDPVTWKKEGIAGQWAGQRGYRKSCCKVCCNDLTCQGCRRCNGCQNSPVRGNYDGLVVLSAVTKENLPNLTNSWPTNQHLAYKKKDDKALDHEDYSVNLEMALSTHFMYGAEPELSSKCVPSIRMAVMMGDSIPDDLINPRMKKFMGYVVYVAYRLEPAVSLAKVGRGTSGTHLMSSNVTVEHERDMSPVELDADVGEWRAGRSNGSSAHVGRLDLTDDLDADFGGETLGLPSGYGDGEYSIRPHDGEEEKMLEELEEKLLLARIQAIEVVNHSLKEQVVKLEHERSWLETRLTALESDVAVLKGHPEHVT